MTDPDVMWRAERWAEVGASHKRAGKGSQDYGAVESCHGGRALVAAVADGHGSRKCFRSDRGARFAVEAAVEQLKAYIEPGMSGVELTSTVRRDVEVDLPQRIVRRWQQRVDEDLATPPGEAELATLSEAERSSVRANPRIAYGTTLVAALLLPKCAVYLQLGDGDVLVVGEADTEPARPLRGDGRAFANETASLSSPGPTSGGKRPAGGDGPWAEFRVRVVSTDPPALVLLTTDGYPNAFVNDAAFRLVATDLLTMIRAEGWEFVRGQMQGWLEEASRQGSGDDVTVAVAVRADLVGRPSPETGRADTVTDGPPQPDHPVQPLGLGTADAAPSPEQP